ncbi:hypothetical protein BN190_4720001 [Clostridioides difficile T14]|nr:hypothetical protein BN187_3310001 [Clostridioides difficile E12]CCL93415.1 hypothetical protein BN190_4720001 [Clostridioides difficile T14]
MFHFRQQAVFRVVARTAENNLFRVGNGYRVFGIGVRKDAAFIYKVVPPLCVPPFHRMPLCFMIRG